MTRDRGLLYAPALARSTGVGMSGVHVGLYASELGRTQAFAWYNVVLDFGHALGALAALLPSLLRHAGVAPIASYRGSFLTVAALSLVGAVAYTGLSANVRTRHARTEAPPIGP